MRLGRQVLLVLDQGGQPHRTVRQVLGHRRAGRLQFGAQPLMLGGLGPVLADPLGHVLDGVPIAQRHHDLLHGGGVAVDYVDRINRSFHAELVLG